jgi:hypothetical protein
LAKINHRLLQEKADVIVRSIAMVNSKKPQKKEDLFSDIDAQDIMTLNIERTVHASVDMAARVIAYSPFPAAKTMADSFSVLGNGRGN